MVSHCCSILLRADCGQTAKKRTGQIKVAFFGDFGRPLPSRAGDCFRAPLLALALALVLYEAEACELAESAEAEADRWAASPTLSAG